MIASSALVAHVTGRGFDPRLLHDQQELIRLLDEASRRYPDDPMVWYLLGDARFHFAWGRVLGVPPDKILAPFDRAIALDSSFTPSYVHAISMAFSLGGVQAGRRYIGAYLAQGPTDVDSGGIALALRLTDPAQTNSEETKRILASASNDVLLRAQNALYPLGDSAEEAVRVIRLMSPQRATSFARYGDAAWQKRRLAGMLMVRGHWHEGYALTPDWEAGVVAQLGGFPAESAMTTFDAQIRAKNGCPPCFYGFWAMRGDTTSLLHAMRTLDSALRADTSVFARTTQSYFTQYGQAYLLLARHDSAAALRTLIALPDSLCYACGSNELTQAQLLEGAHRDRDALAVLSITGADVGIYTLMLTLERGRVAERLGEKEIAVDSYARVAGLWQNGDPFLQPYVKEARAALARLGGEHAQGIPVVGVSLPH